jgi:hypothetical protein
MTFGNEDRNIGFLIALRVLAEQQSLSPPNHMTAVALRKHAKTDQERIMSMADLAQAVIAREHMSAKENLTRRERQPAKFPQQKRPAASEILSDFLELKKA